MASITSALVSNATPAGNVYVSTGNTAITWLSICNYTLANVSATVHLVPAGQTANTQNQILNNLTILPQDTYQLYAAGEKVLLSNNDTVRIQSNVANSITAVTSYTTI